MGALLRKRVPWCILAAVSACFAIGCGNAVIEDRSINTAPDGSAAGFQHGRDGVFVKDHETGELKKIFSPDDDVLATSSPRWSPECKRLIFTTATALNPSAPQPRTQQWDSNPAGRSFRQQPVVYTCWLYTKRQAGKEAKPVRLFKARCDHVGYVAADLAVRWNPSGKSVVLIHRVGETKHSLFEFNIPHGSDNKHAVFEFDIQAHKAKPLFPHAANVLLFDWSPNGSHLTCVVGDSNADVDLNGIWIANTGTDDWWCIPESDRLTGKKQKPTISALRIVRPVWSREGKMLLFATNLSRPGAVVRVNNDAKNKEAPNKTAAAKKVPVKNAPRRSRLYSVDVSTRTSKLLAETDGRYRDIHWSPDGKQFGYVGRKSRLFRYDFDTAESRPVGNESIRRFAGWNPSGDSLAYVVAKQDGRKRQKRWATLLVENPLARDVVRVTNGDGRSPARDAFSDMRITFPKWSAEDQLTLWATFTPSHRFWLSRLFENGLLPGDPAAVLDVKTGKMTWMAVNAREQAQVGHYYMLKRDYAEALRWYDRAAAGTKPAPRLSLNKVFRPRRGLRNFAFFHYLCLKKLGHDDKARAKLAEYHKSIQFDIKRNDRNEFKQITPGVLFNALLDAGDKQLMTSFIRFMEDVYRAEVFCSLSDLDEGVEFFERQLKTARSAVSRLSSATALSQLLLIKGEHDRYAQLATEQIAPILIEIVDAKKKEDEKSKKGKKNKSDAAQNTNRAFADFFSPETFGGLALAPMFDEKFLATIPKAQLEALLPKWQQLRKTADSDRSRLGVDSVLKAAYERLGKIPERDEAAKRIQANPARHDWFFRGSAEPSKKSAPQN